MMAFYKQNKARLRTSSYIVGVLLVFLYAVPSVTAEGNSNKGGISNAKERVRKIVDEVRKGGDLTKLAELAKKVPHEKEKDKSGSKRNQSSDDRWKYKYPSEALEVISEEDFMQLWRTHRDMILVDEGNETHNGKVVSVVTFSEEEYVDGGYKEAIIRLIKAIDSKKIYKHIHDEIKNIKLNEHVYGWGKLSYISEVTISIPLIRVVLEHYGPEGLRSLHKQIIEAKRKELRIYLIQHVNHWQIVDPKERLEYIRALCEIVSVDKFDYSKEELKFAHGDLKKAGISHVYQIYMQLNEREKKKARDIISNVGLDETFEKVLKEKRD